MARVTAGMGAVWAALAACSAPKDGPGTDKPNPLATADGFCAKWAENACSTAVIDACSSADAASCQASQKEFCLGQLPSSGYSSKFAEVCLTAVKDAYADAKLSSEEIGVVLRFAAPCERLVQGAGGDGAVCRERNDCNTLENLDCVKKAGDETGSCRVPEEVGGGFSCDQPQQTCAAGFYCNGEHCVQRKNIGGSCTNDDECAAEALCSVEADAGPGTCVARADLRQPCSQDADCKSNICTIRAAGDGVCVGSVTLSAAEPLCDNLG